MENNLIFKDKELKDCDTRVLGVEGENKQQILVFKIEDSFLDGKGYLELILPDECTCKRKKYAIELVEKDIENECYKLEVKRSLLRYEGTVRMQLKIVQNVVEVYKTKIFEMHVLEAINAVETIEEDYPDLVTELQIRMSDLEDGLEQLDEKVKCIKVPSKISDLENDSSFVEDADYVHTDNNFTIADKEKLDGLKDYDDTKIKEELGNKANSSDLTNFITNAVDDLLNYYTKSESYTKEEVKTVINNRIDELIAGAPETFDTLKEIADYIAEHADVTKALNEAIGNKASLSDLNNYATKTYVDNKIGDIDALLSTIADESEAI